MKYSTEVIIFKSHVKSALNDKLAWDVLVLLMNDLCSTLDKSKAVNHLLLDELKTQKISDSIFVKQEPNVELKDSPKKESSVSKEADRLSVQIKTEIVEDDYEDAEDYFEDEEENANYSTDEDMEEDVTEHECDFCGKSFKSDLNLKRHVRKVHEKG